MKIFVDSSPLLAKIISVNHQLLLSFWSYHTLTAALLLLFNQQDNCKVKGQSQRAGRIGGGRPSSASSPSVADARRDEIEKTRLLTMLGLDEEPDVHIQPNHAPYTDIARETDRKSRISQPLQVTLTGNFVHGDRCTNGDVSGTKIFCVQFSELPSNHMSEDNAIVSAHVRVKIRRSSSAAQSSSSSSSSSSLSSNKPGLGSAAGSGGMSIGTVTVYESNRWTVTEGRVDANDWLLVNVHSFLTETPFSTDDQAGAGSSSTSSSSSKKSTTDWLFKFQLSDYTVIDTNETFLVGVSPLLEMEVNGDGDEDDTGYYQPGGGRARRSGRQKRHKTSAVCDGNAEFQGCCLKQFYYNLTHHMKFVIYPPGYYAGYCTGVCEYGTAGTHGNLMLTTQNREAHPCCTPFETGPLTITYFVRENLIVTKMVNLLVESCYCGL